MKTLLFVCTGNTCRSPMAEAIMGKLLKEAGEKVKGIKVLSAGTSALEGQRPSAHAIQAMRERGLDIQGYQATRLTKDLIEKADIILTMTKNHKDLVLMIEPKAAEKTHVLKEYISNLAEDIMDPFGQSVEIYRKCANEIEEELKTLLTRLATE